MLDNICIFDFETSGLSAEKDRVIEMAAVRVIGGKVVSEFSTLIQFEGELAPKITEITGLTAADLQHGLTEDMAFRILNRFIAGSVLVAHNAAFDLAFLHYSLMRLAGRSFDNPFIDTLTISRDRHVYPHKLENMCERYGIQLDGAHRALNDVHATKELLFKLHEEDSILRYHNRLGYLRKYGPPKWAPAYALLEPTENRYAS